MTDEKMVEALKIMAKLAKRFGDKYPEILTLFEALDAEVNRRERTKQRIDTLLREE